MDRKSPGIGLLATLAATSAALVGCSAEPTDPVPAVGAAAATSNAAAAPSSPVAVPTGAASAPAATSAASAPAAAATSAASSPVAANKPTSIRPAAGKGAGKPPRTAARAKGVPDASTLVTISVVGRDATLVESGEPPLRASDGGEDLKFHIIGFDDENNYQFSLAGSSNRCLQRVGTPFGHVRLAECDTEQPKQRFSIQGARSGYYIGGIGAQSDEYLYQGEDDLAAFDVTPDFEPDRWKFDEHGLEPLD